MRETRDKMKKSSVGVNIHSKSKRSYCLIAVFNTKCFFFFKQEHVRVSICVISVWCPKRKRMFGLCVFVQGSKNTPIYTSRWKAKEMQTVEDKWKFMALNNSILKKKNLCSTTRSSFLLWIMWASQPQDFDVWTFTD